MKGEVNWQPWCLLALQRAAAALGSRGVEAVGAVSQPVGVPVCWPGEPAVCSNSVFRSGLRGRGKLAWEPLVGLKGDDASGLCWCKC